MVQEDRAVRFRGTLLWWDIAGRGRKMAYQKKGPASIERAIMSHGRLTIDFHLDGEPYLATLVQTADATYEGSWESGRRIQARTGSAACSLKPMATEDRDPRTLQLDGVWVEEIDWTWSGRLDPVESFLQ